MNQPKPSAISKFLHYSRLWEVVVGILFYALGAGLAWYLGKEIDWTVYLLGQAAVTTLQLSSYFLVGYYDLSTPSMQRPAKPDDDQPDQNLSQSTMLVASLTTLTVGAVLTVLLFGRHAINLPALFIIGVAFLLAFFYAMPPLRLIYSGYGELSNAFLMANLVPVLAFLFQSGEIHRLLAMVTFPLTALYLAMGLVRSLPGYVLDLKHERKTLMVRLGWQRGMNLHNLLVLFTYLLVALAATLGLPWSLAWRALLSLPLGLFQIWQMNRIASGAKPHWRLLTLTSMGTVILTAYLFAFALWTL